MSNNYGPGAASADGKLDHRCQKLIWSSLPLLFNNFGCRVANGYNCKAGQDGLRQKTYQVLLRDLRMTLVPIAGQPGNSGQHQSIIGPVCSSPGIKDALIRAHAALQLTWSEPPAPLTDMQIDCSGIPKGIQPIGVQIYTRMIPFHGHGDLIIHGSGKGGLPLFFL